MFSYTYFEDLKMIGICDSELLGKKLNGEIEFLVSKSFYGMSECKEDEILEFIEKATNINCIGNRIVDFLIEKKIIEEKNVMIIDGVKHAQVYKI